VAQSLAGLPRIVVSNVFSPPLFISAPVTNCQIVASTNLINWVVLFSTNQAFSNAPFLFAEPPGSSLPVKFYRMSQSPGF